MATYVIGDVQGCYKALIKLLSKIKFNSEKDKIIFCGDLVNRGGKSLEVLKWVYKNRSSCQVVLGNHDLSLLYQYYCPKKKPSRNKEFQAIFNHKKCEKLMNWLLKQKLIIHLKKYDTVIVHAGIYPKWSLKQAKKEAKFTLQLLRKNPQKFLKKMFGAFPNHWKPSLSGMDRARFTINSFTRMRFLYKNSGLNFKAKGKVSTFRKLIPWMEYKKRVEIKPKIIFGHWSALGLYQLNNLLCIDTGKVWGGKLTAVKLSKPEQIGAFIKLKNIIQV